MCQKLWFTSYKQERRGIGEFTKLLRIFSIMRRQQPALLALKPGQILLHRLPVRSLQVAAETMIIVQERGIEEALRLTILLQQVAKLHRAYAGRALQGQPVAQPIWV